MAVNSTYNSTLNEIQLSNLNFSIQLTPYAAYITLKKSAQVDMDGKASVPAPPICLLLQQSYRDYKVAQDEITLLKDALKEKECECEDLIKVNASLFAKIKSADNDIVIANSEVAEVKAKLDNKSKEYAKLNTAKSDIEGKFNLQKKEYDDYLSKTESKIKLLNKSLQNKDKDNYNLSRHLENGRETISNLKAKTSKLEGDIKRLEKKLKKYELRRDNISVESQTCHTIDMPYYIDEPLPPIFGSQLCVQSKPVFMSSSLPNINTMVLVHVTEEDKIQN